MQLNSKFFLQSLW